MTPDARFLLLSLGGLGPDSATIASADAAICAARGKREPPPPALIRVLKEGAMRFRVMGGVWSAAEIAQLGAFEREIVYQAGEAFLSAQALNAAHASRGGRAEAEVAAPIDGGEALARLEHQAGGAILADLFKRTRAMVQS